MPLFRPMESTPFPFDFDADAGRIGEDVEFLDAHLHRLNAPVLKTGRCDVACQGFDQIDVTSADDIAHRDDDLLVADDVADTVAQRRVAHVDGQIEIDPNALRRIVFVTMDADRRRHQQILDQDTVATRPWSRLDDRLL